jgi:hypothetical protein
MLGCMSTLVHEMTHMEQFHWGTPTRSGYHNREWAGMMRAVGLIPSDTGEPGGKQVGQSMSHYIEPGGPFERACAELIAKGFSPLYIDRWTEFDEMNRKSKAASKTRYTCPRYQAKAWARNGLHLVCGDCAERMKSQHETDELE